MTDYTLKLVVGILRAIVGTIGFDSAKAKSFAWNVVSRGLEVSFDDVGGKRVFFVSSRVVGEADGAIKAGVAEAFDGPAIRELITRFVELFYDALFGKEGKDKDADREIY